MKSIRILGVLTKYIPLVGLIYMYGFSLHHGIMIITNEADRAVQIWKDILCLNITIGMFGSLFVQDKLAELVLGKRLNLFDDFLEQDSKDLAVSYNGIVAGVVRTTVIMVLVILYLTTNIRLFLMFAAIFACISVLVTIAVIFYIENKESDSKSNVSKLTDPIILPLIIWALLILITNTHTVRFVYDNIRMPKNTVVLVVSLLVILCYTLAVAFSHFSNAYYLFAFTFVKKDQTLIQSKLDAIRAKNMQREEYLRQVAEYIDKGGEQAGV